MPSCVAIHQGRELVGAAAKRHAVTSPQSTVIAVKRLIGHTFDSTRCAPPRRACRTRSRRARSAACVLEVGGARAHAGRGLGQGPAARARGGGEGARRAREAGGDLRARALQRRAAQGDQARRRVRRTRGAAADQRADRGGLRLRLQEAQGLHARGLRPGRRHLRRHRDARARRHVRGRRDRRRLRISAARTSTTRSPSGSSRSSRRSTARDLSAVPLRGCGSRKRPRRRRSSSPTPRSRPSTCRSWPRARRARS